MNCHRAVIPLSILASLLALASGCNDSESPEIPSVDPPGTIRTWAGTGRAGSGTGDGHPLLETDLWAPVDLTFTPSGDAYIIDWDNSAVRLASPGGVVRAVMGQVGHPGDGPDEFSGEIDTIPPGATGTEILLNHPLHLLPMADGTFILSAWHNHKLRRFDPVTGKELVICGSVVGFHGDGGLADTALLRFPSATACGPDGSIYVLDQVNQRIRKIVPEGTISTVVGTGVAGYSGDEGSPLQAQINMPSGTYPGGGLAFDGQGRLYISDTANQRIRRVDFALDKIETVAGNGVAGYGGDGGPATAASFYNPRDIAFGPDGRLYVVDEWNYRIRAIDLSTGTITTVAGNGIATYSIDGEGGDPSDDLGDGRPATEATLDHPRGIDFDADGNLYIADSYNDRIRRVAR